MHFTTCVNPNFFLSFLRQGIVFIDVFLKKGKTADPFEENLAFFSYFLFGNFYQKIP